MCECGCGRETSIIRRNDPKKGLVKGKRRRFCNGHHHRKSWPSYTVDTSGCWLGVDEVVNKAGYVVWRWPMDWGGSGRPELGHRWYYELENGPIPPGYTIEHICRVRRCVNPDHLVAILPRLNTLMAMFYAHLTEDLGCRITYQDACAAIVGLIEESATQDEDDE